MFFPILCVIFHTIDGFLEERNYFSFDEVQLYLVFAFFNFSIIGKKPLPNTKL
jgi:hypothetical protein